MASYEEDRWAYLSPRRREAVNRLRVMRGRAPLAPPAIDLYRPPSPSPTSPADVGDLLRELRAGGERLETALREGLEEFLINGKRVRDIDVIELPNGLYEGVAEGKTGLVYKDPDEGFEIRR